MTYLDRRDELFMGSWAAEQPARPEKEMYMNPISRTRRRVTAVAMTCAAILMPAAALAAPGQPAAPAKAAAPKCATSDLTAWIGVPGDGAAGTTAYQLELSNTSHHTCTLLGFPGVSAVGLGGHQLGRAAGRDHSDPAHLVTLRRGATAHVLLLIVDVAFFSASACHPANAIGLKVFPPNDRSATVVSFPFKACKKTGPRFLTVRATVAGTGIPGFSH
jgi:hypothetical protein